MRTGKQRSSIFGRGEERGSEGTGMMKRRGRRGLGITNRKEEYKEE